VFVTRDDGTVGRPDVQRDAGGRFRSLIDCQGRRGRQQVEIEARDEWGAEVLANFPVWCGDTPPSEVTFAPVDGGDAPPASAAAGEQALHALVNETRAQAGLAPLAFDPALAAVARAHSDDMAQTGIVGHVSPTTGTAADRVRSAGIRTGLVLENVARAYGVREAHDGLLNSPGHRANLMSAQATHIGIGLHIGREVGGRRELLVTEVFTRVPPAIDKAKARSSVRTRIHAAAKLADSEATSAVAQQLAEDLAGGASLETAVARANKSLGATRRIARANTLSTVVADLDTFDVKTVAAQQGYTHVGVGVAQGTHDQIGPGAIYVVVIVAQIR
jgi:uncharacterized protein YkwD